MTWPYTSRPASGSFNFASTSASEIQNSPSPVSGILSLPSRAPSPSPTDSTNWSYPSHPKRVRLSRSVSHSRPPSFVEHESLQQPSWSTGDQALFEKSLARLTASAGFPLRWVENPEWQAFCEQWIPNAKIPSRKVLAQRIIPATLKEFKEAAKLHIRGSEVTATCDGWTGGNHHYFIAFMVTCNGKVYCSDLRS